MKNMSVRKSLAAAAGAGSLTSGIIWYLSADAQLKSLSATGKNAAALAALAAHENHWAAFCAAATGIALAVALFFE